MFEFKNYYFLSTSKITKKENFPLLKATNVGKDISSLIEKKDKDKNYIEEYFKELKIFFETHKNLTLENK